MGKRLGGDRSGKQGTTSALGSADSGDVKGERSSSHVSASVKDDNCGKGVGNWNGGRSSYAGNVVGVSRCMTRLSATYGTLIDYAVLPTKGL